MINIDDIIKRSRYINLNNQKDEYDRYHNRTKLLIESNINRFDDTKFVLQHWQSLDENQIECFKKIVDLLDEAYERNDINGFNYIKSYIINEAAPVVRDAKQTARYLKYKTTRIKNKISEKLKKNTDGINNTTQQLLDNIRNTNSQSISTDTVKKAPKSEKKKELDKEDIHEAYIQILDTLEKYNHCDRVLENVNIIQKRFNIMNMVENTDISNDYELSALVDSICECINTYDADFGTRFNSVLETSLYYLNRSRREFNKSLVVEQTVNNFISKDLTDDNINQLRSFVEYSVVLNTEDKRNINYIYNTPLFEEDGTPIEPVIDNNTIKLIQECDLVMDFDLYNEASEKVSNTVKDIVNDFKMRKVKKSNDVRTCVSKMFTKSPDQIIDGTPNFLSWVRMSYVIGATAINPVLGAITLLVDQYIAHTLKRRDVSKMITVFKTERKVVAAKLKTADESDKKNLKEYDKYLKNGIEKLEDYEKALLSDKELEAKETGEKYDKDSELEFLKDDDDDDDFLESTSFEILFEKSGQFSKNYFTDNIIEMLPIMNEDMIDTITDTACNYPNIISNNKLYTALKEQLDEIKNTYSKWVRISCLSSNIRKISENQNMDNDFRIFDIINELDNLFIEYHIFKSSNNEYITEDVSTNIKMLSNKLRKAMQKASDIDKETSRKIDSSVNMFITGMQRAARNDNREAIIRGSILPSTSKIVKAAILDAGVALVNPALAVILAVGQFAISKKMKVKERQLVLDEIEIEIEMCKRYLRQAEDQNDLEAQKKILRIQRNLERQKQRIQYNMKIHWNQDIPNTSRDDD